MPSAVPTACTRYSWCLATGVHTEHYSDAYVVSARGGRRVSVFLAAGGDRAATVAVEVRFGPAGPALPVCELHPGDALVLAEALRRLGAEADSRSGR